ncbi:GNAT family N-acetyltransferase [Bacillus sp. KH172YL63]|uniref:GNAT family N-acetyltransferase n=1 Tax=Bacillus sp. KH172YL63 TaxID=2709784 RepID=UPI0013E417C3|nr:GNAT family N-acetyltransferase [Bacillus sp. KH172YL63]BCB02667.1 N-acetyltransferase [Bacillus sp. KH172YL63]
MKILELERTSAWFEEAVKTFWGQWGNEDNYPFYYDCMFQSCRTDEDLPRFYIALKDDVIIGTYALLRNDLNSRQDLYPWLGCLYVEKSQRGSGVGPMLMDHGLQEARKKGYHQLYLSTDLDGFYEKYGWIHDGKAIGLGGGALKVYRKSTD